MGHHEYDCCLLLYQHVPETSKNVIMQLNPIIGETLEGGYADGTKIYC